LACNSFYLQPIVVSNLQPDFQSASRHPISLEKLNFGVIWDFQFIQTTSGILQMVLVAKPNITASLTKPESFPCTEVIFIEHSSNGLKTQKLEILSKSIDSFPLSFTVAPNSSLGFCICHKEILLVDLTNKSVLTSCPLNNMLCYHSWYSSNQLLMGDELGNVSFCTITPEKRLGW
jgi:hypothetical protein